MPTLAPSRSLAEAGVMITCEGALLERTEQEFERQAVLNPACIEVEGIVHMYYRAVKPGNYSSIGYCKLWNNQVIYRSLEPVLKPEFSYESHGIEDPRIIFCDGLYYLIYTVFDGLNAQIAYATSSDLLHFQKQGLISPELLYHEVAEMHRESANQSIYQFFQHHYGNKPNKSEMLLYEKDAFIFPRKINGKFALVHRVFPEIQVIYFDNFSDLTTEYWHDHLSQLEDFTLLKPKYWFESRHIGGGCPPIETADGWLFIYHAVEARDGQRVYHAAAALLDLDDPTREISRLPYPLFSPEADFELKGDVNNVVFPSGAIVKDDRLYLYYGAADSRIGIKSLNLSELLAELRYYGQPEVAPDMVPGHFELANSI